MSGRDVSDKILENAIRDALMSERLPRGVADSTLDFIHTHAAYVDDDSGVTLRGDVVAAMPRVSNEPGNPHRLRSGISRRRFVGLMAAAFSTAAVASAGVAFAHETASVSVEGSESIVLGLNRWNIVVRCAASSVEIDALIDGLNLRGLPFDEALDRIAQSADISALLSAETGILLVASSNSQKQLDSTLEICRVKENCFGVQARSVRARDGRGQGKGRGYGAHNRQKQQVESENVY